MKLSSFASLTACLLHNEPASYSYVARLTYSVGKP